MKLPLCMATGHLRSRSKACYRDRTRKNHRVGSWMGTTDNNVDHRYWLLNGLHAPCQLSSPTNNRALSLLFPLFLEIRQQTLRVVGNLLDHRERKWKSWDSNTGPTASGHPAPKHFTISCPRMAVSSTRPAWALNCSPLTLGRWVWADLAAGTAGDCDYSLPSQSKANQPATLASLAWGLISSGSQSWPITLLL